MRKQVHLFIYVTIFLFSLTACQDQVIQSQAVFHKLSSSETGISFANDLVENDSLNYFTYPYLYMGGGVSAGDINNDGLVDLYFTGNKVPNKLYLNKGNLHFEDISESAGVLGDSRWYTGVTMADVNSDGFLDIYCSVAGKFGSKENQLFINNGDNTFNEKANDYNLADSGNSVQATFFDYDLDGDLDVYVANYPPTSFKAPNSYYLFKKHNAQNIETDHLYRNDGDGFTEVTDAAGMRSFGLSLSATVSDINKDGWPDIYVSNDFSTPDLFYINNQDGTFSEQVKAITGNTSFYGMGVDISDINNDGNLDLYQVDMSAEDNRRSKANMAGMDPNLFWTTVNSGFHFQYMQNSLQLNNGMLNEDGLPHFSNISRLSGVSSTDWSWGPIIADLDNDGWKDIFVANGSRREINNKDYFNKLKNKTLADSVLLEMSLAIPSEKIDNYVFKNNGDLTFERVNKKWGIEYKGFSNGSVYADLDNDGDLEIITNNLDDEACVFNNTSSNYNNYISLNFKGSTYNPFGIGVKVEIQTDSLFQFQELTLSRGFQSSVAPVMHFGIGSAEIIESINIQWPDGKSQTLKNIQGNQSLTILFNEATEGRNKETKIIAKLFSSNVDSTKVVKHGHIENYYDDFIKEILLPHKTSMFGPGIDVGDLNGDKLDDFMISGSTDNEAGLFFQTANGFEKQYVDAIVKDKGHEDMGIHFFDIEGDGDQDIYVVSGGNEFEYNSPALQDRLYINDGRGNFSKSNTALPKMITSGSRVHSFDYDKDGDLDLFVGGRLVPGSYPVPANSYLLQNQSTSDNPKFVNVTDDVAPALTKIGLVTDAIWTDYDNDGWQDLIVVGEWMPITVLKNNKGKFEDVTSDYDLDKSNGWWFGINQGDFDDDGDMDYIVGNLGLNYKYQAKDGETFDIYFNDFDENSTGDIVLSYFNDGENFPVRGRQCSSQQIPTINYKFKDYESFSTATIADVYTQEYLDKSLHYQVESFASIYLENRNGQFISHELPISAQISSINQILIDDYNKDGNLDAIIAGNLYSSEVETPRNDASVGLFLEGNGKGSFNSRSPRESGFSAIGDVKDLAEIIVGGTTYVIAAKNSDYLQFIQVNK